MKHISHIFLYLFFICLIPAIETPAASVRVNTPADSLKATKIVSELQKIEKPGDKIVMAARELIGAKISENSLKDSLQTTKIDLSDMTPVEFISYVLAFAKGVTESRYPEFKDFTDAYVKISRRKGVDGDFSTRLLYASDWIVDNVYRGHVAEMTERIPENVFKTKSLDYYSTHREAYPALADSITYDNLRMVEMGYRSHKVPHLKKQTINKKSVQEELHQGDIIVLLTNDERRDIYDIGFITIKDGQAGLIHASPASGEIVEESITLPRYFKIAGQYFYGYRIIHPTL